MSSTSSEIESLISKLHEGNASAAEKLQFFKGLNASTDELNRRLKALQGAINKTDNQND